MEWLARSSESGLEREGGFHPIRVIFICVQRNFISVQARQGIWAEGYTVTPLRTGYEQVLASRVTDLFATMAQQDGKVTSVEENSIVVTYKDGTQEKVLLGKRYGKAAGYTYPQTLVTDLKVGDKVKSGGVIAYNRNYFMPDTFNPGHVVLKAGVMCKVALMDPIDALEDGSVISEEIAKQFTTQTSEVRTLQARFDQSVRDLVKVGDHVDLDSILCIIEDPEIRDNPLFNDIAMDTLRKLSSHTPRAKVTGVVSRVEVFYHGEFEDMSESLQGVAGQSNRRRRQEAKASGQPAFDGQVDTGFRIRGAALDPDSVAIQVTIDHDVGVTAGDKLVYASQLKSVISRVMTGRNETESGEAIDALFGNTSVEDRMVLSPKLMGTTNTLLRVLSQHIASVYRGRSDVKRP